MQCDELVEILELDPDGPLTPAAAAHAKSCARCADLLGDLGAIRLAAGELSKEEVVPPERVWISLRAQLESEGLIRQAREEESRQRAGWWFTWERPALAGAFLAAVMVFAGLAGHYSKSGGATPEPVVVSNPNVVAPLLPASMDRDLQAAATGMVSTSIQLDPSLTASLQRNLSIVDNVIAMCEKSVREHPDNDLAREYLYGAYQQKAELLASALSHSTMGEY